MAKPGNDDVLRMAQDAIGEFYQSQNIINWRRYEVRENYSLVDGCYSGLGQWATDDLTHFQNMNVPIITANKVSPVIDAITGFEIQNRADVDYIPRVINDQAQGFNDMVGTAASYIEHDSHSNQIDSLAFRDMVICGVGSCDFDLDYKAPPHDGNVKQVRVFPGFCGWDVTAIEKNLRDAEMVWRSKIVRADVARKLLKGKGMESDYSPSNGIVYDRFIDFFNLYQLSGVEVDIVYKYQWRTLEPFYRVKNPFHQYAQDQQNPMSEVGLTYAMEAEKEYGFKLEDYTFNLDAPVYRKFNKDMQALGIKLEKAELDKYRYWRATIVGNVVTEVEENVSQKGFSQKFMTGKYDENNRMFYGAVRGMKEPQRMLNRNLSRYEKVMSKAALGGDYIEEKAVSDMGAFLETKAKSESSGTVIVADGALQAGKIMPRPQTQFPTNLDQVIPMVDAAIMGVVGVSPSFMGLMDTADEQSGILFSRKVRQGLSVLSWSTDAMRFYKIEKGDLYIDFVRTMAQNNPGRMIRDVTGTESEPFMQLFEDGIAEEYDIVVDIMPSTPDERYEFAKQLLTLSAQIPQLAPLALDGLPFDKKSIDEAKQALQPAPPPPPDPDSVALVKAETANKTAQAQLNMAKAATEMASLGQPAPEQPIDMKTLVEAENKQADRALEHRKLDIQEAKIATDAAGWDKEYALKERELNLKAAEKAAQMHGEDRTHKREHRKLDIMESAAKTKVAAARKKPEARV